MEFGNLALLTASMQIATMLTFAGTANSLLNADKRKIGS